MAFRLTKPPEINPAFTPHNILDVILGLITGKIGDFGSDLATAITTGVGAGILGVIGSFIGGIRADVDTNNELIEVHGTQIADLEDFIGTGTSTPMYASTGGRDLVTFPDTMMQPIIQDTTVTHRHGGNDNGTSFTSFASTGLTFGPPAFNQAKNVVDFAFLRGGRDTDTALEVIRVITGSDTSIFDIDAWYLGIYVQAISRAS
jgi:hypothetical protein